MRSKTMRAIIAAMLLPVLAAALSLWSFGARTERISKVPAAVVNLDQGALFQIDGKDTFVPAGRLIAAELIHPATGSTFDWMLISKDRAMKGLADGTYRAVLTIPEDFSRQLAKMGTPQAQTAKITVTTNGASDALTGQISDQLAGAAASVAGKTLTRQILDGIYLGFNTLKDSLLAAGSGANDLSLGMGQLHAGYGQLTIGLNQLASGSQQLSSGLNRLAPGANQLATGANQLLGGLTQMRNGIADNVPTPEQMKQLSEAKEFIKLLPDMGPIMDELAKIVAGDGSAVNPGIFESVHRLAQLCALLPPGADPQTAQLCAQIMQLDNRLQTMTPEQRKQLIDTVKMLAQKSHGFDGNSLVKYLDQALSGPQQMLLAFDGSTNSPGLLSGTRQLAQGSHDLANGLNQINSATGQLSEGITDAASGSARLNDGLSQLHSGSKQLADGLRSGAGQIPSYSQAQRKTIVQNATDPISSQVAKLNPQASGATAAFPLVAALVLWLGAFCIFLVMPALNRRVMSRPVRNIRVVWASLWPPMLVLVIGALGVFAVARAFGVQSQDTGATVTFLLGVACVFPAIIQALMAVFGAKSGRIIGLLFMVFEAASLGGMLPLETAPEFFQALNHVLPLSITSNALSTAILTGGVSMLGFWSALLIWLALSLILTTTMVSRYRSVSPTALVGHRPAPLGQLV